ncbi:hypothetical protein Pedsa_1290 [Pseudopedobacter saltans DSM 12145]|uniref:Uncharacterized protein n=1 Tax=Pseudopedobacter saltans (strain ATCC 51119 / DSM 12145 / JCM 21818 / CCUG 39354 / LMG 10337 / NBRC 100064 / NCIMB 13643) TaxID=762903 RepID=F0SDW1_PSESL|nr:hypothetical protein [Pseudopedobacter saltans]ADY51857.1 hypothetical protein Pedsa_1290 [Pseudopedobacter saltans DSM 12145]
MLSIIQKAIYFAGFAQIILVFGSLLIPRILQWTVELDKVQTLIKQMFWTYAAYILVINLCFGILSILAFEDLTNGSFLACIVCGFIAIYWISRVAIQFFYFDRTAFPPGIWNKLGEIVFVLLFFFLATVYSWAFYYNYQHFY